MEIGIKLARETFTPIYYWLDMPIYELIDWLEMAVKVLPSKGDGLMWQECLK